MPYLHCQQKNCEFEELIVCKQALRSLEYAWAGSCQASKCVPAALNGRLHSKNHPLILE